MSRVIHESWAGGAEALDGCGEDGFVRQGLREGQQFGRHGRKLIGVDAALHKDSPLPESALSLRRSNTGRPGGSRGPPGPVGTGVRRYASPVPPLKSGNIRALQNLVERGVISADDGCTIDVPHMLRREPLHEEALY